VNLLRNDILPVLENPFFHRGPIRDRRYFFGRKTETRRALQMLRQDQCVSIVGPRRVGKTSYLFHLCDAEVQREHELREEYLFVYIDCQGLGDLDRPQFYQWVWEGTERALAERGQADQWAERSPGASAQATDEASGGRTPELKPLTRLRQILATRFDEGELRTLCFDLGIRYDTLPTEGTENKARELVDYLERHDRILELVGTGERLRPDIAWDGVLDDTFKVAEGVSRTVEGPPSERLPSDSREFREAVMRVRERGYRPVFLFDEFEYLATSSHMDEAVFSSLRNLSQELQVAYVTASQMPVGQLIYHDHSALHSSFFSNFQDIHVGFLKPEEAERMVLSLTKMAGQEDRFSEKDLTFVFEIAGYHPFFLQLACYYLFEHKLERDHLVGADYELPHRQYAEDTERFFRYAWDHLDEDERESTRLASEGHIARLAGDQVYRLERKCILHANAVFSSAFAEFVRKQAGVGFDSRQPMSTAPVIETAQQHAEPRSCQLSVVCSKLGWVGMRISGSLSYEADSLRALEQGLVDRLNRRAADALRSKDWRFQIKEIGRDLFEELILNRPEIEKGYQRAVGQVEQGALSLALHAPRDCLRLPFEALHSEDEGYLCLKFPMYHVVSGYFFDKEPLSSALIDQLDSQGRHPQALVVASDTWGAHGPPIPGVEKEASSVADLLGEHGFDVCLLSADDATERRVRDELTGGGYLLFHYAGHGTYSPDSPEGAALYFWEETKGNGEIKMLTASQLAGLVQNTPLRFVYLSSCRGAQTAPLNALLDNDFLGVMDGLVMGGVPAVLGFRWPVGDNGAQLLAQSFYSAWLEGGNRLDRALYEARRTVADQCGRDDRAWFSPILVMRASGL
jgi:hypothetical protein